MASSSGCWSTTSHSTFVTAASKATHGCSTYGAGSYSHIVCEMLNQHYGLEMEAVHYRGEGMDYYTMVADSWGLDPSTREWRGYVDYAGNKYTAVGPTAHAYLAIDATLLTDEKKAQKVLPGRSILGTTTAQEGQSVLPDAN